MNPPEQPMNIEQNAFTRYLRKVELSFYFLFAILAVVCFILPPVYHLKYEALYIAAVLSILYSILIYFTRYGLVVYCSIMIHVGLFLVLASTICFSFGYDRDGIVMVVIGSLQISLILVLVTLRKLILRTNWPILERVRQRQNAQNLPNQPLEGDEGNNGNLPNGQINNLNMLDDGNVINVVLANIQDIPNGHAIQAPDFPPNQQVEEENEQVEGPEAPADIQMENPNEQIAPEQQE